MIRNRLVAAIAAIMLMTSSSAGKAETPSTKTVVLSKDNVILLNSEVDGESTAAVISQARKLDAAFDKSLKGKLGLSDKKPIYLFMNTPGGSIQSGLEMIEALNGLGRPVNTVTLFAASMGFQIVQNLGERYILKNGVLMSHRARGEFAGEFGGTYPSQVESRFSLWAERLKEMDLQTVKRTKGKQTLESYQKQYATEMWPTGKQSVEQGYADEIVLVKCDASLDGATTHSIEFFGVKISYDLDNCPLNTNPMNIQISQEGRKIYSSTQQEEIKNRFLSQFQSLQRQIVPMRW